MLLMVGVFVELMFSECNFFCKYNLRCPINVSKIRVKSSNFEFILYSFILITPFIHNKKVLLLITVPS